jgi:hypothetical protein
VQVAEVAHDPILDEGTSRLAFDTETVGHGIACTSVGAQDPRMDAFLLQSAPRAVAPRRYLGGTAVVLAVLLSIWMLVAAGLQRSDLDSGPVPEPLPDVPAIVQADDSVGAAEIAPAPGAAIAPMEGSVSPR